MEANFGKFVFVKVKYLVGVGGLGFAEILGGLGEIFRWFKKM